jgi:hypothetical protein
LQGWLDGGGIVVLGQVASERPVDRNRRSVFTPESAFISEFRVALSLAGHDLAGESLVVGPHGFGNPDCAGGARLLAGEKLILFAHPTPGAYKRTLAGAPADSGDWQGGQGGFPHSTSTGAASRARAMALGATAASM